MKIYRYHINNRRHERTIHREKMAKSTSSLRHRRIAQSKRESLKFCCIDLIKNIEQVKYKTDIIWELLMI